MKITQNPRTPNKTSCYCLTSAVFAGCLAAACALHPAGVEAQTWTTVYQSDFSTDPSWISSDGTKNYWNGSGQNYHVSVSDGANDYAYTSVTLAPGRSYRLQFDACITRSDWAGNVRLGLGDSDMRLFSPAALWVDYGTQDYGGQIVGQFCFDSNGGSFYGGDPYTGQFALNTWYHNDFLLDATGNTLTLTISRVSDGARIGTQTISAVGSFAGLDRIFVSSIGDDYARGATGAGYLDNVVLLQTVPEPGAGILLGLGGLLLLRRRMRD